MLKKLLLLFSFLIFAICPSYAAIFSYDFSKVIAEQDFDGSSTISITVLDKNTKKVLYSKNENKMMNTASALKLYTFASALDTLGEDYKFEIGKGELVKEGTDVTIIANGLMVAEAIEAGKELEKCSISAEIINMATIKPLDSELVVNSAKKTGKVITVEEHNIVGGLGEAVCAALSAEYPVPVKRIGINDEFGHSGPAKDLLKEFGLSAENIVKTAKEFLK